jgi:hypothetical protein
MRSVIITAIVYQVLVGMLILGKEAYRFDYTRNVGFNNRIIANAGIVLQEE